MCSHPLGAECHIDGHIPAANNDNFFPHWGLISNSSIPQEINAFKNAREIFTLHVQRPAQVETCGEKKGLKAFTFEVFKGDIFSKGDARFDLHPHIFNDFNLRCHNIPGKSVLRNAYGHHASSHR